MSILNKKDCSAGGGNTGFGDCFIDLKNIVGGILVPLTAEFTAADLASAATMLAALQAAIIAAPASRVYPMGSYVAITDNSEAPVIQTFGYGGLAVTREGLYNLSFQFLNGGLCLSKSLRKFNSQNRAVLLFDASGLLVGWKSGSVLKGIPLDMFYQNPLKLNDGSNVTAYVTQLAFKPIYLNDFIGFVEMNISDLSALTGLQDIVLSEVGASAEPNFIIKLNTGCNGADLYDIYADELAYNTLWKAYNQEGEAITITSVTKNTNNKAWNVTIDGADPDVSGPVIISLVSPAELAAAGIDGYDSIPLTIQ